MILLVKNNETRNKILNIIDHLSNKFGNKDIEVHIDENLKENNVYMLNTYTCDTKYSED